MGPIDVRVASLRPSAGGTSSLAGLITPPPPPGSRSVGRFGRDGVRAASGALAFSGFGARARMLRGDNVSLPHLQQKVILGRVRP